MGGEDEPLIKVKYLEEDGRVVGSTDAGFAARGLDKMEEDHAKGYTDRKTLAVLKDYTVDPGEQLVQAEPQVSRFGSAQYAFIVASLVSTIFILLKK